MSGGLAAAAAYVLTMAEAMVSAAWVREVSKCTAWASLPPAARPRGYWVAGVVLAVLFEAILLLGIVLVQTDMRFVLPILAGAAHGAYWTLTRRS